MSDPIKLAYKGAEIEFSERNDDWHCAELDMRSPSMKKIKQKIDAHWKTHRDTKAVNALKVNSDGTYNPIQIVEYLGACTGRFVGSGGHGVAVQSQFEDGKRGKRHQTRTSQTYKDNPHNVNVISKMATLRRVIDDARSSITDMISELEPIDSDDLRALMDIHFKTHQNSPGEGDSS